MKNGLDFFEELRKAEDEIRKEQEKEEEKALSETLILENGIRCVYDESLEQSFLDEEKGIAYLTKSKFLELKAMLDSCGVYRW